MRGIKIKSRLFLGLVKSKADLTAAKLMYFYGPNFSDHEIYSLENGCKILTHPSFNITNQTVLYIHGYLENPDVESIHVIAEAYLCRKDINIILLDWGDLADGNYLLDAVVNAKQLGTELAKKIIEMFNQGLNISKFHVVGHSLGGQMSGMIGREIYRRTEATKKLKRITALDPAFPPFYLVKFATPLSKNDAEFVDVIHTDAWIYGAPFKTGTADFWPNGGKTLQPGCPRRNYKMLTDNDLSSHRRSWWFWAESVANKYSDKFNAIKAKNWTDFKARSIEENYQTAVVMGHDCPDNINGDFYLQTNGTAPFARGIIGTCYVSPEKLTGFIYTEDNDVHSNSKSSGKKLEVDIT